MKFTIRRLLIAPLLTLAVAGGFVYLHLTLLTFGFEPSDTLEHVYRYGLFLGIGSSVALLLAPKKRGV
jgi:hypothetical protein